MAKESLFDNILWNQGAFGGSVPTGAAIILAGKGLIYPALRKAGVTLGPQRTPSPAQYQDGLEELNRLVGSLSCDRLNIYSITKSSFPLTGAGSYTIGQDPSGETIADFDTPRPVMIEAAGITGSQGGCASLAVVPSDVWTAQCNCSAGVGWLYNDRAYPISTLYLSGSPTDGILELHSWQMAPAFVSIDDAVLLPPGYEDAIVLNLAIRLAPHFQRVVDPDVRREAQLSLMRLESINAPRPIADTSEALSCGCGYDIRNDCS
jgi:hypothetical protein